jgi:putative DNA primase/helicase
MSDQRRDIVNAIGLAPDGDRTRSDDAPFPEVSGNKQANKDKATLRTCELSVTAAREPGKATTLFKPAALERFADLAELGESGEGECWERALVLLAEARGVADEYSASIGAPPRFEAAIKKILRKRATNARRAELRATAVPPDDFPLADEFIRRNRDRIFRDRRTGTVYLWDEDGREWLGGDEIKRFVVAFLKGLDAATAAEQEKLWSSRKLASVFVAIGASDTLPTKEVEFDANPYLLGLPEAQVCDLRLGMSGIRDRQPDDFVTMQTAVFPEAGETPKWDGFLGETFKSVEDKGELVAYMRRLLGYCATGLVSERKAYVLDGHGMNGKSTLCKVMRRLLGDGPRGYALVSKAKVVSATYDGHDTIFAALENKRFVEIPEVDRSLVLGARFKELTGNDSISARGMRQDERPIALRCKLGICANNNIKFDATSKSYKERLATIPFRNKVVKPDGALADKLLAEGPAILADIIEHASHYLAGEGFPACVAVDKATKSYADAADMYADFFNELYTTEPPLSGWTKEEKKYLQEAESAENVNQACPGTPLKEVFAKWLEWADGHGESYTGNSKLIAGALREKDILVRLRSRTRDALCVGLRPVEAADRQRRAEAEAKATRDEAKAAADGYLRNRPSNSRRKNGIGGKPKSTKLTCTGIRFKLS